MNAARRFAVGGAVAILVVSSAGCSGSDDGDSAKPSATPSAEATPTIDPNQIACRALTAADREALTGVAVDEVVAATGTDGSSQCRWQSDDALVQVTTLPAELWARTLPSIIAELEKSGTVSSAEDKADVARTKKLLDGAASFTGREACDVFETLSEIGGGKKRANTTVSVLPITETETGLSAQTCTGGTLTSVIYSVPGLKETKKSDAAVRKALAAAQKRARG